MDVDRNSTSYRGRERGSLGRVGKEGQPERGRVLGPDRALAWKRKPPKTGKESGAREYPGSGDVKREKGASGARPHLVQLVLEHF